jgi:hypothetical protein
VTGTYIIGGNGAPAGTVGRIGDFYIDLVGGYLYGPKAY